MINTIEPRGEKRDEPIQHISRRRRPGNRKISRQTIRTGRLQGKKSLQRHGGTRHPHDRTDPSDPARCHDAQNERPFRPDENKRKKQHSDYHALRENRRERQSHRTFDGRR